MAKLSKKDVEHIAKLSKLKLSEQEKEKFAGQLSNIIEYVEQLDEVDTKGVEPTSQATGLTNVYREDEIKEDSMNQKEIAKNAPDFDGGSFRVPGIFNSEN